MIHVVSVLVVLTSVSSTVMMPDVVSYSKVSKNGQETNQIQNPLSWVMSATSSHNNTINWSHKGRSAQHIDITVSPIYAPPRIPKLKPGEAVNHPSTKKYSILDKELLAKLNTLSGQKQAHERFTPPAIFTQNLPHYNNIKQHENSDASMSSSSGSSPNVESSNSDVSFPGPVFSGSYDYVPSDFVLDSKPKSKPSSMKMNGHSMGDTKIPDLYHDNVESDHEFHNSEFDSEPLFYGDKPPKLIEYDGHFDHPTYVGTSYGNDHEISYDHIPDDNNLYHHHYTTTEKPEMNDQRLSKRPYSYYYIGKKLWYIPLYFSIYFIIYVAALVLKSIARHKINFPAHLASAAADARYVDQGRPGWWDFAVRALETVDNYNKIT